MEVAEYLEKLPKKRKEELELLRSGLHEVMPIELEEVVFGESLIRYELPLEKYPKTYNKQPLMFMALAGRNAYSTITLTSVFNDKDALQFLKNGLVEIHSKIDLKTSCVKIKNITQAEIDIICKAIKMVPIKRFIQNYEALIQ